MRQANLSLKRGEKKEEINNNTDEEEITFWGKKSHTRGKNLKSPQDTMLVDREGGRENDRCATRRCQSDPRAAEREAPAHRKKEEGDPLSWD